MKNKLLLTLLIVLSLFLITGCGKKEETNEKGSAAKAGNKSYTCISEGEMADGGKTITKLVVVLDKDNYIVENQIINEHSFKSKEMYDASKAATENNIKTNNESTSKTKCKWTLKTDDKTLHYVSTRIYDMSGVRDSQGKTYDEIYNHFNEDGTYNIEDWMAYQEKPLSGGYKCSQDK